MVCVTKRFFFIQGFGVTARSTAETRRLDPTGIAAFRQADVGEYLRDVGVPSKSPPPTPSTDSSHRKIPFSNSRYRFLFDLYKSIRRSCLFLIVTMHIIIQGIIIYIILSIPEVPTHASCGHMKLLAVSTLYTEPEKKTYSKCGLEGAQWYFHYITM